MAVNSLNALNAYQQQLKLAQNLADPTAGETEQSAFSNMLKGSMQDAADAQYNSEATQMQSLTGGKVELTDLVSAISNADLTLSTVVAVRDRVISAYQDIIRMAM